MEHLALPSLKEGWLPAWLLLVTGIRVMNLITIYFISPTGPLVIYAGAGKQKSPLLARVYGMWLAASGLVNAFCAYDISNPTLYLLSSGIFALVIFHWVLEVVIYRTVKLDRALASSQFFACTSLIWMLAARDHYTQG